LRQISTAWYGMLLHFQKRYPEYPGVPRLDVKNINSDEVVLFTESHKPDLIVVSGTSLIKRKFLRVPVSTGIINLHTGLSPYIKGGPNCTNWCIATQQFHLIGNTVMWIDEGIDSGNLIATAVTPLDGNESLSGVHLKVMEHAHELYVKSIANISNGARTSVPQREIADGITYYNKEWGLLQKINLIRNIKKLRKAMKEKHPDDYKTVKTVDL
jgi:methionyl-tRNA formyltransferase